ncbi:MAG: mechanosensitive ion channel [bacterium]|nr:mechanosensitive ion channel [bacterium]
MIISPQLIEQLIPIAIDWSLIAAKSLALLVVGWVFANWISNRMLSILIRLKVETTIRRSLKSGLRVVLKTVFVVLALNIAGVQMTALAAILGGLSISFGLALKGNISNVANGILLLINKPFKAGDFIEMGSVSGTVERIDLINTILKSSNNQKVIVPNSHFLSSALTNFSVHDTRRIEFVVGLSYDDDVAVASDALKAAIQTVEGVLDDPVVDVWLTDFGESSINVSVRAWCTRTEFMAVRHRVIARIQKACNELGYSIPYPQRDVHVTQA